MATWRVEFTADSAKEFRKLDTTTQRKIAQFLRRLLSDHPTPRSVGRLLHHQYKGLWRYRVGDYRIICEIFDEKKLIEILGVGHRREVYRGH